MHLFCKRKKWRGGGSIVHVAHDSLLLLCFGTKHCHSSQLRETLCMSEKPIKPPCSSLSYFKLASNLLLSHLCAHTSFRLLSWKQM